MKSYSRFGVTSYNPTTQFYNYPATCHNNKLTDLIYDGVREVDCKQAKTIMNEGSSVINKTRWLEGDRKEDNRTEKKITRNPPSLPDMIINFLRFMKINW